MKLRRMIVELIMFLSIILFMHKCFYAEYGVMDYYLFSDFPYQIRLICEILILSYLGVNLAHILGYYICGKVSGYKLISIEIYSIFLRKKDGKLLLERYKGRRGLHVNMAPPEFNDGNYSFALYNAGAIVAFMVVVAIVSVVMIYYSVLGWSLPLLYQFCVFIYFFMNAMNYMLPLQRNGMSVVKKNYLLKRNYKLRRAYWNTSTAYAGLFMGNRLREQPKELFVLPDEKEMSNPISAEIAWLRMNRLIDEAKFEEADRLIDFMLSDSCSLSDLQKKYTLLEKIYIELITANRADVIKSLLNGDICLFMKQHSKAVTVIRTAYALECLYYENSSKAEEYWDKFFTQVKNEPYPADVAAEIDLINLVRRITENKVQ